MNAFVHAEQLALQHELIRVIENAAYAPLTRQEQRLLAWASGVQLEEPEDEMER